MATSSNLAAMLAARQAAATPTPSEGVQTPQEQIKIPASLASAVDIENVVPVHTVQVDAMVVSKILKHARDFSPAPVSGQLLGLDINSVLEISNSYPSLPFPPASAQTSEDDDKKSKAARAKYNATMLRLLRDVGGDDQVVGVYVSARLGAFLNESLFANVPLLVNMGKNRGFVVVHDTSSSDAGNANLRAFRLSPSFADAFRKANFSTSSLVDHSLTFSSILVPYPLTIHTSSLASAFLSTVSSPSPTAPTTAAPLTQTYTSLDLSLSSTLESSVSSVLASLDAYKDEQATVAFQQRQLARERARADHGVQRENAQRAAQGLKPLTEQEIVRQFRLPQEPSRLQSMLLLGQLDGETKRLGEQATAGLLKGFGSGLGPAQSV